MADPNDGRSTDDTLTYLEPELLIPPRDAAERLGVSPSGLRRLATLWEEIYGPIHWEGEREGGGRVYPLSVVTKLEAARGLVREGKSKSIQNALQALDMGATPPAQGLARPDIPYKDVLHALLSEMQMMREELSQLRADNAEMRNQLPPPEASDTLAGEVRVLHEQVATLAAVQASILPSEAAHSEPVGDRGDVQAGVLVRAASRLERLWRAVSGRS